MLQLHINNKEIRSSKYNSPGKAFRMQKLISDEEFYIDYRLNPHVARSVTLRFIDKRKRTAVVNNYFYGEENLI